MSTGKATGDKPLMTGKQAVDAFMHELAHPLKPELERLRQTILQTSPDIEEGMMSNAPGFLCKDHFATFHPQSREFAHVIFHLGAKPRADDAAGLKIADPSGLLVWLAKDRCAARFHTMNDVESRRAALQDIVRQWIRQL